MLNRSIDSADLAEDLIDHEAFASRRSIIADDE